MTYQEFEEESKLIEEENDRILKENYQIFLARERQKEKESMFPSFERMVEDLEEAEWYIKDLFRQGFQQYYLELGSPAHSNDETTKWNTFVTEGETVTKCFQNAYEKLVKS